MNSTEEIEKQVLNDTYLQFVPDNGSETTIINQTLNIQIPRGPEVLRMNASSGLPLSVSRMAFGMNDELRVPRTTPDDGISWTVGTAAPLIFLK